MDRNAPAQYTIYFVAYISIYGEGHPAIYVETDVGQETGFIYHVTAYEGEGGFLTPLR